MAVIVDEAHCVSKWWVYSYVIKKKATYFKKCYVESQCTVI